MWKDVIVSGKLSKYYEVFRLSLIIAQLMR